MWSFTVFGGYTPIQVTTGEIKGKPPCLFFALTRFLNYFYHDLGPYVQEPFGLSCKCMQCNYIARALDCKHILHYNLYNYLSFFAIFLLTRS